MSTNDWRTPEGLSSLSAALDEIYFLRAMLADEAGITEAHLSLKSFPKSRRRFAEEQVDRMKAAASGDLVASRRPHLDTHLALLRAGAPVNLTEHQWAKQRRLVPTTPAPRDAHEPAAGFAAGSAAGGEA